MNLNSKLDKEALKEKFFEAVGDTFALGAPVAKLEAVSLERGVWTGVEDQLVHEGITSTIKLWIRSTKDPHGHRVYHSLPSRDAEGNEIPIYKPVALFDLNDYKVVLAQHEKRIGENIAVYLDLVTQAEERYGYHHRLPVEVKAYVDAVAEQATSDRAARATKAEGKRQRRGHQPEAKA